MEKYPIGLQSFEKIRRSGFVYVDKTAFISDLLNGPRCYFLSRPRRFGKSLFLSTLEAFFLGKRDLFQGLAIDSYDWDWVEYPVIRINFTSGLFRRQEDLYQALNYTLAENERQYGITPPEGLNPVSRFRSLISSLYDKFGLKVVVLVDEYDKPLLDVIDDDEKLNDNKYVMAGFYSVIKASDEYLKMVFLTGVTRFGHMNIFSGLNNLTDISLEDKYAAICGISQEEINANLMEGVKLLAENKNISVADALEKLKDYYDGYHFSGKLIDIYNPFSLLNCLNSSRIIDEWFLSGSSSYLIRIIRENRFDIATLDGTHATEKELKGVDSSMNDAKTLLYQSGYLTIKAYDSENELYTLGIPNKEVKGALFGEIIPYYLGASYKGDKKEMMRFNHLLETGNAEEAMTWLKGYFKSIPYDVKLDYEAEFQQVVYAFFALAGMLSNSTLERQTSDGRIDMALEMRDYVYIFEFKIGSDASKALEQINSKGYAHRWAADRRHVIKVGVAFSPEARGIADYKIETK